MDPPQSAAVVTPLAADQVWTSLHDLFPFLDVPALRVGLGPMAITDTVPPPDALSVQAEGRSLALVSVAAVQTWPALAGCEAEADPRPCVDALLFDLAERAWRRPLTDEDRALITGLLDDLWARDGVRLATRAAVQLVIGSPWFLYRVERAGPATEGRAWLTSHEVAARLALLLWDGLPDDTLRAAAAADALTTAAQVQDQARRMLGDDRAARGVARFHATWLEAEKLRAHWVDVDLWFPGFPPVDTQPDAADAFSRTLAGLEAEIGLFTTSVVLGEGGTFRELLTSTETWTTEDTRTFVYGPEILEVDLDTTREVLLPGALGMGTFARTTLGPDTRAGLPTLAGVLAPRAGPVQPSPVRRGVFLLDRLLCDPPDPPPAGIPALAERPDDGLTNRERMAAHSANPGCAQCHAPIDGIGFTFEHYTPVGSWRDEDAGRPVDASGALVGTDVDGPVADAVALAAALAGSRDAADCYAEQWYRYAFGDAVALDDPSLPAVQQALADADGVIVELIVALAGSDAFRSLTGGADETP